MIQCSFFSVALGLSLVCFYLLWLKGNQMKNRFIWLCNLLIESLLVKGYHTSHLQTLTQPCEWSFPEQCLNPSLVWASLLVLFLLCVSGRIQRLVRSNEIASWSISNQAQGHVDKRECVFLYNETLSTAFGRLDFCNKDPLKQHNAKTVIEWTCTTFSLTIFFHVYVHFWRVESIKI